MSDDDVRPEDEPEGHVTSEDLVPGEDVPEAPEEFGHEENDESSEDVDERLASDDDKDDDSDNQLDLGDTPDE